MYTKKLGYLGVGILLFIFILLLTGPFFVKYGIEDLDPAAVASSPSLDHLFGTDELGRDVLARFLYGGKISLLVGLMATFIQISIAVLLGVSSGYFGGIIDALISRIIDIIMCFPFFIMALSVTAIAGPSILNLILILGTLSWPGLARIIRSKVLSLKNEEFIQSSKISGFSHWQIIYYHILPNLFSTILVGTIFAVAYNILSESSLSFLGMGIRVPESSWGNMLATAQSMRILKYYWWMWFPAGLAVVITVISINWIGEMMKKDEY